MKAVLVTGGCGFIGGHFIRLLMSETKFRVINIDKLTYAGDGETLCVPQDARCRFVKGDIADGRIVEGIFEEEKPEVVVNFAAESHVDRSILNPAPFLQTNVTGVQELLRASRRHDIDRFLQISTDEVYGDAEGEKEPPDEAAPLRPSNPYSASKAAADLLCQAYLRTYGTPIVIVRSSNNYGPKQFPEKLLPLMIRNALDGKALPVYGDGQQKRDWLYVEDNCRAILRALEQGRPGSVFNVGTGAERTNLEVVRSVCRVLAEETGRETSELLGRLRLVPDRPGHDRRYAMNAEKIRRELRWAPEVTFEHGLRLTVRWYLAHQDWMARVINGDYEVYYDAVYTRGWRHP